MARKNSLLTQTQRDYLRLSEEEREENYTKQQRSYHRREIRKRFVNTVLDFNLLFEHWPDGEREKAFTEARDRGLVDGEGFNANPVTGVFGDGISAFIALLYIETYQQKQFNFLISRGTRRGYERLHPGGTVSTTIDIDEIEDADIRDALRRYRDPGLTVNLSDAELAMAAEYMRRYDRREAGRLATEAVEHFDEVKDFWREQFYGDEEDDDK